VVYDKGQDTWKVEFSSAGFLSQAKGPMAGFFQSQLPSGHQWQSLLVVPEQLTAESGAKLGSWAGSYAKRRKSELGSGKHSEVQFSDEEREFVPHAKWQEQIIADWAETQRRFNNVPGLSEDQQKQAVALFEQRQRQLADFLVQDSLDIQTWRHELWRLENNKSEPGANGLPFQEERIAEKSMETKGTPRKWVGGVSSFDEAFVTDLSGLLTEEQKKTSVASLADEALTTAKQKRLARMDIAVTGLIIGVGICLLAGFCTRIAALGGALFLLSVIVTQPPWVPGAVDISSQVIEFAAMLLLAAVGAGRWAGLDSIIHCCWSKCCGTKAS